MDDYIKRSILNMATTTMEILQYPTPDKDRDIYQIKCVAIMEKTGCRSHNH